MEMLKSGSLADAVFEQLEEMIVSGELEAGENLTELRLSKELNVSRTPIREAIRRLEQEGLVKESGKGVKVVGVSIHDLEDIYEIRSRIEGLAARKCAECATDKEIEKLKNIVDLQEFYTQKGNAQNINSTDSEFHNMLYELCRSEVYYSMLSSLHRKVQRFRKISVADSKRAQNAQKEHRMIFEAIKNHDGDLADKLAVAHIINAKENIMKNFVSEDK